MQFVWQGQFGANGLTIGPRSLFFIASFCELRHSGFSSLCPWQILVVVVFVGPCPVRFLLCFSAGWRSAYLAGGSAFRPLRFGFVVSFVFLICQPT